MNNKNEMTMADHAEAWARESGETPPERGTHEWERLYKAWHEFAFADFGMKKITKKGSKI